MKTEEYVDEIYFDDYPGDSSSGGDEGDDDSGDEDDVEYEWITNNGGCAICTDMAQDTYDEEPAAPHEFCDCTVRKKRKAPNSKCRREYSIEIGPASGEHDPNIPAREETDFKMVADYVVHCPDGTDIDGTVEIDVSWDDMNNWGDQWPGMVDNALLKEIMDDPDNQCEPCEAPGVA